eukprot:COSAG01_NODE_28335_length_663_cov_1.826241_1_plen_28_part_10
MQTPKDGNGADSSKSQSVAEALAANSKS